MPARLLLEGPDIEGLLTRVREEHGTSARILRADRVRSGGIAGLFAKQRYEVAVEVDRADDSSSAPPALRDDAPAFDVSITSGQFAPVLARLAHDVSEAADAPGPLGLADRPAIRAFTPPRVDPSETETRVGADEEDAARAFSREAFAAVSAAASVVVRHERPRAPAPALDAPMVLATVEPPAGFVDSPLRALGVPESLAPRVPAAAVPNTHRALARMVALLPEPPRLVKDAGAVTVVVGDGAYAAARIIAKSAKLDPDEVLLAAPGMATSDALVRRNISSAGQARLRAAGLWAAGSAVVVAVDVPATRDGVRWAREVVEALCPHATWALVDATRKNSDLLHQLARIGHVDALVVERTSETVEPASVLGLGVPVAQVDGRRASGAVWSELLGARLAQEDGL